MFMKKTIKLIAILFIIIGLVLINYDVVMSQKETEKQNKRVIDFFKVKKENKNHIKENPLINDRFIGIIEIPSIKLKNGFVNPLSVYNNIDENITILKPVMMPDEKNSIFVLAAHSGNSNNSYFKDLYKLKEKDSIYIYYKNKKYEYKVIKYYEEVKDGNITIKDNSSTKKLVLTTCKSFDKQLVYIAYLDKTK